MCVICAGVPVTDAVTGLLVIASAMYHTLRWEIEW